MKKKLDGLKFGGTAVRLCLGFVVPLIGIAFLLSARPMDAARIPLPTDLHETERAFDLFPVFLMSGDEAGLREKIHGAKRIALHGASSFERISGIHRTLSAFHSGLSIREEERLSKLIYHESLQYGYDPELIVSLIMTESSFYKWARSREGAIGLMQIQPVTGRELAAINQTPLDNAKALYDPHLNIKLGIQYLALLHKRFGNLGLALTAYNYGPTRVAATMNRGERPPYGYTQRVLNRYQQLLKERPQTLMAWPENPAS